MPKPSKTPSSRARAKPRSNRRAGRKGEARQGLAAFLAPAAHARHAGRARVSRRARGGATDIDSARLAKFFVGLALLPACWALLETFLVLLKADTIAGGHWQSAQLLAFSVGAVLWLALFFFARCRAMVWCYVAGHELTHALFVLLFRGKVTRIRITSEGGHILTDRNNFLISLSPYFFPFYSVAGIAAWAVAQWVWRDSVVFDPLWLCGLVGFTWSFHLSFTLWMIRLEQSDVEQNGRLFSFSLIFLANLLLICLLLVFASPTARFGGFFLSWWENLRSLGPRFLESFLEIGRLYPF